MVTEKLLETSVTSKTLCKPIYWSVTKEVAIDSATQCCGGETISLIRLFQNLGLLLSANGTAILERPNILRVP